MSMAKTEVFIWLHLPRTEAEKASSRAAILACLEGNEALCNIMLITAEGALESELSFGFEHDVALNGIINAIIQSGAKIIRFSLQLPSSFTGVANVYDARDAGGEISDILQEIEGVNDAGVRNNGTVHVECGWHDPDRILTLIKQRLLRNKNKVQ